MESVQAILLTTISIILAVTLYALTQGMIYTPDTNLEATGIVYPESFDPTNNTVVVTVVIRIKSDAPVTVLGVYLIGRTNNVTLTATSFSVDGSAEKTFIVTIPKEMLDEPLRAHIIYGVYGKIMTKPAPLTLGG